MEWTMIAIIFYLEIKPAFAGPDPHNYLPLVIKQTFAEEKHCKSAGEAIVAQNKLPAKARVQANYSCVRNK